MIYLFKKIQIELAIDKKLKMNKMSKNLVKKCICADEKIVHEFHLEALDLDMNKGLKVSVNVFSLNETSRCTKLNKKITKRIRFRDVEVKTVLVEVNLKHFISLNIILSLKILLF